MEDDEEKGVARMVLGCGCVPLMPYSKWAFDSCFWQKNSFSNLRAHSANTKRKLQLLSSSLKARFRSNLVTRMCLGNIKRGLVLFRNDWYSTQLLRFLLLFFLNASQKRPFKVHALLSLPGRPHLFRSLATSLGTPSQSHRLHQVQFWSVLWWMDDRLNNVVIAAIVVTPYHTECCF